MGMLAAVEMWVKRDHKAEWKQWEDRLAHISTSVTRVNGVTAKVNQPNEGLSNRTPSLQIAWARERFEASRLAIAAPVIKVKANADRCADNLRERIQNVRQKGIACGCAIAAKLSSRGVLREAENGANLDSALR